ncbi:5-deoxy-glucuronate isomerase [Egibacter rhizosphaerae]|uniref:5-deoxy-glucuronate isomerase n=1 Tax=Egibacter rhizosphaerae TaxID=1670831 RepID=A0A411YEH3_9ACTN|nr:5-deoxy-glucuronate isomerase [Egibacter rhizosphaerae]QBI19497.1 5-deoxy-glucuronate isomerase [Egibacter rhizosphaerae]
MSDEHVFLPRGRATEGDDPLLITPARAGWDHAGLRVLEIAPGRSRTIATGTTELAVLPLSGGLTVTCETERYALAGRESVFHRVSDFAYVPRDSEVTLESERGARVALPFAEARTRRQAVYGPAEEVPVEVRGGGNACRQVNNFLQPEAFPGADRLIAVELLTPDGLWSSWPPHKHDEERPGEVINEEIYYFEVAGRDGFAVHKLYTPDGAIDATETVRDGDAFLIPRGYHGPSIAAPGFELYYLNVLAGPGEQRAMTFCDDPTYAWQRSWLDELEPDPRLPLTSHGGRVGPWPAALERAEVER